MWRLASLLLGRLRCRERELLKDLDKWLGLAFSYAVDRRHVTAEVDDIVRLTGGVVLADFRREDLLRDPDLRNLINDGVVNFLPVFCRPHDVIRVIVHDAPLSPNPASFETIRNSELPWSLRDDQRR